jgi:hypothetical protein
MLLHLRDKVFVQFSKERKEDLDTSKTVDDVLDVPCHTGDQHPHRLCIMPFLSVLFRSEVQEELSSLGLGTVMEDHMGLKIRREVGVTKGGLIETLTLGCGKGLIQEEDLAHLTTERRGGVDLS